MYRTHKPKSLKQWLSISWKVFFWSSVLIIFLVAGMIIWHVGSFILERREAMSTWKEVAISLPDRSGRVVYMQKSAHTFFLEHYRKVRLETKQFQGCVIQLPINNGGSEIKVYWYPIKDGNGPYLSMDLGSGRYIIDPKKGKVCSEDDSPEAIQEVVIADSEQYMGHIQTPYPPKFVSAEEDH